MVPVELLVVLEMKLLKEVEEAHAEIESKNPSNLDIIELVEAGKKLSAAKAKTEIAEYLMAVINLYSDKEEA